MMTNKLGVLAYWTLLLKTNGSVTNYTDLPHYRTILHRTRTPTHIHGLQWEIKQERDSCSRKLEENVITSSARLQSIPEVRLPHNTAVHKYSHSCRGPYSLSHPGGGLHLEFIQITNWYHTDPTTEFLRAKTSGQTAIYPSWISHTCVQKRFMVTILFNEGCEINCIYSEADLGWPVYRYIWDKHNVDGSLTAVKVQLGFPGIYA